MASRSCNVRTDPLTIFTFLWGQVMILQGVKLSIPFFDDSRIHSVADLLWPSLMFSACALGILAPKWSAATLYLVVVSLVVLWCTGSQSNHVFMDVAVCFALVTTYSRDRKLWMGSAAHAVRTFLVALYSVTALHKMNTDWYDVNQSCSVMMFYGVVALRPLTWMAPYVPRDALPCAATLTEMILPLLLATRFDRVAAFIGCAFHLVLCPMLSPMSVYPFSILMAPLYVFIVPKQASFMFDALRPMMPIIIAIFTILCKVWIPLMASDMPPGETLFEYPAYGLWAPGVLWCIFVYISLIAALWLHELYAAPAENFFCGAHESKRNGWILGLVVMCFGLTPYIGIRNYPALAMFSNLRTEGGRSNHLFIRDDFDFIGWQRDYVTIHSSNILSLRFAQVDLSPHFTSITRTVLKEAGLNEEFWITPPYVWPYNETRNFKSFSMPYLELRRRIASAHGNANSTGFVRYTRTIARANLAMPWLWTLLGIANPSEDRIRANIIYDLSVGGDAELETPLSRLESMFARFRTFDIQYSPCRH